MESRRNDTAQHCDNLESFDQRQTVSRERSISTAIRSRKEAPIQLRDYISGAALSLDWTPSVYLAGLIVLSGLGNPLATSHRVVSVLDDMPVSSTILNTSSGDAWQPST